MQIHGCTITPTMTGRGLEAEDGRITHDGYEWAVVKGSQHVGTFDTLAAALHECRALLPQGGPPATFYPEDDDE